MTQVSIKTSEGEREKEFSDLIARVERLERSVFVRIENQAPPNTPMATINALSDSLCGYLAMGLCNKCGRQHDGKPNLEIQRMFAANLTGRRSNE